MDMNLLRINPWNYKFVSKAYRHGHTGVIVS